MIKNLRINQLVNPLGIDDNPRFSFIADEGNAFIFKLFDENMNELHSQKVLLDDAIAFSVNYPFDEGKKYFWSIDDSELQFFSVTDRLNAPFISVKDITHPLFVRKFDTNNVKSARLVITGLGLYVAYLNGERVGDMYLTPGFNDYDEYLRYQTYDVTKSIKENNTLEVILGDGIYMGRMGFDNHPGFIYGDQYYLSALLVIEHNNGSVTKIKTDDTWKARRSEFLFSTIYDGEIRDASVDNSEEFPVIVTNKKYNLVSQFNPPIRVKIIKKPTLMITPKGEHVLDFGQNMVGFVRFKDNLKKGQKVHIQYGEILQEGNFYRDNLRSAKAELKYVSDGKGRTIEACFTYYGFRYIKVDSEAEVISEDYEGCVLYSDLEETLTCTTNNPKINRLIENVMWSQRGNFMDSPTDCPQRDERLGWTGDIQVFSATACLNMNGQRFLSKFMKDIRGDQVRYYHGAIPGFSPSLKGSAIKGGSVWADAVTVIPKRLYDIYGDITILKEEYPMIKDYINWLIEKDKECGNTHIITNDFTFGDWLAGDGFNEQSRKGGTDDDFIRSVYYYHSLDNARFISDELGLKEDADKYKKLAVEVKKAIYSEFFSENGRLTINTQTGYALSLYFDISVKKDRLIEGLKTRLQKDGYKIKTGFTGTPIILDTLIDNGMVDDAFRFLFSEKLPGWLYAVNLGATTIWERWNSVLEDGSISGTSMNSLNHYAYGSVGDPIYSRIAGLKNGGNAFKSAIIEPHLNYRLKSIDLKYASVRGDYRVKYTIRKDNTFELLVTVPHGCKAKVILPYFKGDNIKYVEEGTHTFDYLLTEDLNHPFSMHSCFIDILECPEAIKACSINPKFLGIANSDDEMKLLTPFGLTQMGYLPVTVEEAEALDKELKKVFK